MGRPVKFRPAVYPVPTPWRYSVFVDPYERVNVWSHAVPGVCFLLLGLAAKLGAVAGANPLLLFCCCSATTHLLSAITHAWPDDFFLEKLDHIGIVALIAGTPVTAIMATRPEASLLPLAVCTGALLIAAMLPPLMRTLAFITIGVVQGALYLFVFNMNLSVQCLLYLCGAVCFIRNDGHVGRLSFLTDHHLLHYFVTTACCMHVCYIWAAMDNRVAL